MRNPKDSRKQMKLRGGIRQFWLEVQHEKVKSATLYDLYERLSLKQTIIFTNSKRKSE